MWIVLKYNKNMTIIINKLKEAYIDFWGLYDSPF